MYLWASRMAKKEISELYPPDLLGSLLLLAVLLSKDFFNISCSSIHLLTYTTSPEQANEGTFSDVMCL